MVAMVLVILIEIGNSDGDDSNVMVVLWTVTRMLTVKVMVVAITIAEFRYHCNHHYHQTQEQQKYYFRLLKINFPVPDRFLGWFSAPCCSIQANENHILLKKLNSCDVPRSLSSLYPKGLK